MVCAGFHIYINGATAEKFLLIGIIPALFFLFRNRLFFVVLLAAAEVIIAFLAVGNIGIILIVAMVITVFVVFLSNPFIGICFVALVIPVDVAFDIGLTGSPSHLASFVLLIAWLIRSVLLDRQQIVFTNLDLPVFILLGYIILTGLWCPTPVDAFLDTRLIIMGISIYITIIQIVKTREQMEKILWIFCIMGFMESIISVFNFSVAGGDVRAEGYSGDFNATAEVLLFGMLFLIGFLQYVENKLHQLFITFALGIMFLGLISTGSRGPLIILIGMVIVWMMLSKELIKTLISFGPVIIFLTITFLAAIILTPFGDFLMVRVESGLNPGQDDSFMSRVQLWMIGIEAMDTPFKWLFGIGLGGYHELFPEGGYQEWFNPHSLYVLTLVEFGLFGCVLLFILIIYITIFIAKAWLNAKNERERPIILGFFMCMVAYWIQSVIAHAYYYNKFWFFLALGTVIIRISQKTKTETTLNT